ncbi:MAG TPA: hypothetical protein VGG69_05250 [Rhizomicrobium sp.]
MEIRSKAIALFAASILGFSTADAAVPQALPGPKNRFLILPNNTPGHVARAYRTGAPLGQLPQWNGSFVDTLGRTISFTMVGPNPATSNATTTIPVVVVPVQIVFPPDEGHKRFDPSRHVVSSTGRTVLQLALRSPLFRSNVRFVQGGVNLGKTQYIDAFQRGNFWRFVKTNSNYHVLLGSPTVLDKLVFTVPSGLGQIESFSDGVQHAVVDLGAVDTALQTYIETHKEVQPGVLPIFLTYNTYLETNFQCCVGGYHSAAGGPPIGQTYIYATFVDDPGQFSQDIEGLSHEIGEWMDDPFVDNVVDCSGDETDGFLEAADPLEDDTNFGAYPYKVGGYTYNLEAFVFMPYWGDVNRGKSQRAPSLNRWFTFQGSPAQNPTSHDSRTGVCPGSQGG